MKNLTKKIGLLIFAATLFTNVKVNAQAGALPTPYCMPAYSQTPCNQPGPSNAAGNFINDFIFSFNTTGALTNITNNGSGCNAQTFAGQINNYFYHGCLNYIVVSPGQNITCNFMSGNVYSQGCAVFVDWNMDGIFQIPAERVTGTPGVPPAATWAAMNFVVPGAQANGIYRMRVRCAYATTGTTIDPCNMYGFGETEDYNLYIGTTPGGGGIVATANPTVICAGQNAVLTGTGGLTYTWTPGAMTGSVQNVSPLVTTIYTVTGMTAGGCPGTTTVQVKVNPSATVTAVALPTGICVGQQSTTLTGGGALTYTWQPGNIVGTNIVVSPGATTIYTVTGTPASGCVNSKTVSVTVNPLPIVAVNSPTGCVNTTIGLTANGGVSYVWAGPLGYNSPLQNPNVNNATLPMSGFYTVTATDALGCKNTAVANLQVVALPTPVASTGGPVCVGGNLILNATGGQIYGWSGPNGFLAGTQNTNIPAVTMLANGVYSLIVSVNSCTAMATTNAVINPLPTPVALSNAPVCEGQSLNFTGSGGVSYNWTGPVFTSNQQNPGILVAGMPNNGNYVLTVTDVNGCINSTNINIVVNALPVVGIAGSTVCANQVITLGATGGTSYSWTGPAGFTSNLQNPTIPNANTGMAGNYNVTVTNANNCVNTNFVSVIVNNLPTPTAASNGPLCLNQVLSLNATGGLTYSWAGPAGYFGSGATPSLTASNVNMSGNYTVTATDNIGCTGIAVTPLIVNPLPNVSIVSQNNKGCVPLCATFTCATSPGASVSWAFGDGASQNGVNTNNCFKSAADYTVIANVTDLNGCFNNNNFVVNAYPVPVADFNFAPIRPIANGEPVVFTDATHNGTIANWNWYFTNTAASGNQSNVQNPQFIFAETGTYPVVLVVKSDKGCSDTVIKAVFVGEDYGIYVPTGFSPNGDGLNDVFQPKGFGITKYEFEVFDRWGEKVFSTNDFNRGWDGTVKGLNIKDDVFAWRIKLTNVFGKSHELTGHVTLIK